MTATAETSTAAYRDSAHHHPADRDLILALIRERGDLTCDEAVTAIAEMQAPRKPTPNDISGRFTELRKAGLIVRTGEKRETVKKSKAYVWILKPQDRLF